jgi:hypothetical protein
VGMRSALMLVLAGTIAHADWRAPKARKLVSGDLGLVRLVKSEKKLVVEVYFPRAWQSDVVKDGAKIPVSDELVLADAEGVFFVGPAPVFRAVNECENDGGPWLEPVGRLELDPAQLLRVPKTKPIGGEKIIGLATLGKRTRKALEQKPGKRTLMRVDFDGDGAADAELRSAPSDAGCGIALEEEDLLLVNNTGSFGARCCGP